MIKIVDKRQFESNAKMAGNPIAINCAKKDKLAVSNVDCRFVQASEWTKTVPMSRIGSSKKQVRF